MSPSLAFVAPFIWAQAWNEALEEAETACECLWSGESGPEFRNKILDAIRALIEKEERK